MTKNIYHKLADLVYYALIVFIAYTASNKFFNIEAFQLNIAKTGMFSNETIYYLSYAVVAVEITVLGMLIFFKNIGLNALFVMIFIFTIYISYLFLQGKYEVCGCGGVLNGLSFYNHLSINILLILGTLFVLSFLNNTAHEI